MTARTESPVDVYWVPVSAADRTDDRLLDAEERDRLAAFRRSDDARRFLLGRLLVRLAAARHTGQRPERVVVQRSCEVCGAAHGKPRLPGSGLAVSVAHGGDWVVVALAPGGELGVDVEPAVPGPDVAALGTAAAGVLDPAERAVLAATSPGERAAALLRYWTRKEAVLKCVGVGLREPMSGLRVSPPERAAALLSWPAHPEPAARLRLADLAAHPGHLAALARLGGSAGSVVERDGTPLLEPAPGRFGASQQSW